MPITADPAPESLQEEVATPDRCLIPVVRWCTFFDERGRPFSSSRNERPPEAELTTAQRCVDESLRRDVDVITRTSSTECIAVIRLRDDSSFAKGCTVSFRVDPEATRADVDVLGGHLIAFLEQLMPAMMEFSPATGLPTRKGLERRVKAREASAAGSAYDESSILCLNIDRLHLVNETRGFEAGDQLIAQMSKLLQGPLLPSEGLASHLFGGEFAVVLLHTRREDAVNTAEALQQAAGALGRGYGTDGEPVSVSCGIACFHTAGEFQNSLACAELACKTAQDRGRGRVEVFQGTDASMIRRFADGMNLRRLRDALRQEGQLLLFAQKIVSVRNHDPPFGYEILLRSAESQLDNVAPAELLAAAQRNQMSSELDWWVLEHTISEAAQHRAELISRRVWLSINVTGPSLTDDGFVDRVHRLISCSGLSPALITFEIIESAAVSLSKASSCIAKMGELGYRFALDDFGTGNNSLKTLTSLPVHCVKIDGSFVRDILVNAHSEATVRAIVSLAKDLGIFTVAEYAENTSIIELLHHLGVDYVQGYGIEHPRPFGDALRSLR